MPDKASRALRRFCLDCQGGHVPSVSACKDTSCLLFPYRRRDVSEGAAENDFASPALRVIRRFCLDCAGNRREVRECDARENCSLWSYRFGVQPATFKRVIARRKKKRGELRLPGLSKTGRL
jgi:hypothetical protein